MDIKTGVIKSVTTQTGETKGKAWKRYVFEMEDGHRYSTFDDRIGTAFKAGQFVEMSGTQKGDYWNMVSMKLSPKTDAPAEAPKGSDETIIDLLRQILAELKS